MEIATQAEGEILDPAAEFVARVEEAMLKEWRGQTGEDPPDGCTAFAVACWRVAAFLVSFDPRYRLADVEISCHGRTWAQPRMGWETPPILLCDYCQAGPPRRRWLFWLVLNTESESHVRWAAPAQHKEGRGAEDT